eukprot:6051037-Amphidinium_carterae.1
MAIETPDRRTLAYYNTLRHSCGKMENMACVHAGMVPSVYCYCVSLVSEGRFLLLGSFGQRYFTNLGYWFSDGRFSPLGKLRGSLRE